MLRIVNQHYNNLRAELTAGGFGNKLENISRVTHGGGFFGVSSKMIRNMYVLSVNLIDKGEVELSWAFEENMFRHFLTMLGVSVEDATDYKYYGNDHATTRTHAAIQFGKVIGTMIEVTVKVTNRMMDTDKNVISTSNPVVGVQILDTRRSRFDLMLDNPLHVAYGMIEARKKSEKVVVSFNSPGYPSRARESEALHLVSMELFNSVAFYNTTSFGTKRNILGIGNSIETLYVTHRTIVEAMGGSSPALKTFVYDFTNVEEFTCSSLLREKLHYDYSLFPLGRLRPSKYYNDKTGQRYELSNRVSLSMLKMLRDSAAARLNNPAVPQFFDNARVVLAESLYDVIEIEKDFYLQDTAISKKKVIGSLRQYYADVGGIAIALVRSETRKIVDNKEVRSFSLIDLRNGVEVIRCEATFVFGERSDDTRVIQPITTDDDLGHNLIDVEIFTRRLGALLKNGRTVIVRRKDKAAFTLHPYVLEALPYAGDKGEVTDDRIKHQTAACFTNVVEVELKQKPVEEKRGYQFLVEPQR